MDPIVSIRKVSYTYNQPVPDPRTGEMHQPSPVFTDLDIDLPGGMVTLVGPNGTGKSTLLLLASGRLLPDSGTVSLLGTDTKKLVSQDDKNQACSFIYQNMEFETEDPIGDLLEFVFQNGFHKEKKDSFVKELIQVFELSGVLGRKTQEISKGELQRTILAFSLLYGSRTIMMDEPMFAMEESRKHKAMEYFKDFSQKEQVPVYFSAHNIDISRKYADKALLFFEKHNAYRIKTGDADSLLSPEELTEAFQVPYALLHQKESIHRQHLQDISRALRNPDGTEQK